MQHVAFVFRNYCVREPTVYSSRSCRIPRAECLAPQKQHLLEQELQDLPKYPQKSRSPNCEQFKADTTKLALSFSDKAR